MTEKSYTIRLKTEGGKAVEAEILGIGDKGEKSFRKIDAATQGTSRGLSVLGASLTRNLIGMVSAPALIYGLKNLVESLGNLKDTAERLGVSTDALQEFRFAAVSIGEGVNVADEALGNFTKKVGEAQQGMGKLLPLLKGKDFLFGFFVVDSVVCVDMST